MVSQFSPEGIALTLANITPKLPNTVYPIGRLDKDSEGLLLLSDDQKLNSALLHPDHHVEKSYWVQVEGIISKEAISQLESGVTIENYQTKPATVYSIEPPDIWARNPPIRVRKTVPDAWLSMTISEGKNRQIRKMTASVGLPCLRLIRYQIGKLTLNDLQPGQWRNLTIEEFRWIQQQTKR